MIENDPLNQQSTNRPESNGEEAHPAFEDLVHLVREVGSAMASHDLASIDLRYQGLRLSIVANDNATASTMQHTANGRQADEPQASVPADVDPGLHTVSAPMIGTFYVAPAPNEPPFVNPGDSIEEGQTIGIIEAMKIMNEIASDKSGEIVEVIAKNGDTVEFGSPLVTLRIHG